MKYAKSLIDPSNDLLTTVLNNDSLLLSLANNYVTCLDNLDYVGKDAANILCMSSTSGTYKKRKLYTDNEEYIMDISSIIYINGINIASSRADLLDRSIVYTLGRIKAKDRIPISELDSNFEKLKPTILSEIFITLSYCLETYENQDYKLFETPRMADFYIWGCIIAKTLGIGEKEFDRIYKNNIDKMKTYSLEENAIVPVFIKFIQTKKHFEGTATRLLEELGQFTAKNNLTNLGDLPKTPNKLTRVLNRLSNSFRSIGIEIEHNYKNRSRNITISYNPKNNDNNDDLAA
ncbi:hypothetical protein [Miniphocaeibacter halophilus]|uniref:Uncharacterized protein n=1 Tax=Miniphocaeibacter halophilus TaxID=2931922 RepID=A0AC61MTH2_9FIRM|nr:hypothetical protein [Miniphocaeibacter halophilus]QQK09020.1 hypothetical protein JFY71_05645 [Miniphocaeibacter halophilus]